jgi:hypothetical protein
MDYLTIAQKYSVYQVVVQPSPPPSSRTLHLTKLKLSPLVHNPLLPSPCSHHSFFLIIHLFTCAYIVWVISPLCPLPPPQQLLFYLLTTFCAQSTLPLPGMGVPLLTQHTQLRAPPSSPCPAVSLVGLYGIWPPNLRPVAHCPHPGHQVHPFFPAHLSNSHSVLPLPSKSRLLVLLPCPL